jgi:hypothetical protein
LDLSQLINDIHGINRKPALGSPPPVTQQPKTEYTAAATAVASVFVAKTINATFADPQLTIEELMEATCLSEDDVEDALHELRGLVNFKHGAAYPQDELFAAFDKFWMDWNPTDDAIRLAADLLQDEAFPHQPAEIAAKYNWLPQRLNPAIAYLANRKVIRVLQGIGSGPFVAYDVPPSDATRRFVRSRS